MATGAGHWGRWTAANTADVSTIEAQLERRESGSTRLASVTSGDGIDFIGVLLGRRSCSSPDPETDSNTQLAPALLSTPSCGRGSRYLRGGPALRVITISSSLRVRRRA